MKQKSNISKLINRKLNGDKLSDIELFELHNYMIENDKDYANDIDDLLAKELKKYVPKGTQISKI